MQQTTVKAMVQHRVPFAKPFPVIYLVRDGDTVFYIGQSSNVYYRLDEHLGLDWHHNVSALGQCISDNLQKSGDWIVELYTLADCEAMAIAYRGDGYSAEMYYADTQQAVDDAEIAMIHFHRPCLNGAANPDPAPLPSRYDHRTVRNPYGKAMGEMLGFE